MNDKILKFVKKLGYAVFFVVFVLIFNQLFLGLGIADEKQEQTFNRGGELTVIFPDEPGELNPQAINSINRQRLINSMEPLVKFDHDLKIKPALALSWGLIDEHTWEINLRPGVRFHDGSDFEVSDVLASLEKARFGVKSELTELFSTIESVEEVDRLTLNIRTKSPDPLLLQKLSLLLIHPAGKALSELPVGTGPYKIVSWKRGGEMIYESNSDYWGGLPTYDRIKVLTITDRVSRFNALTGGEADFLAFVPFDGVKLLEQKNYSMATVPSLEVQFLTFNFTSPNLDDFSERSLVKMAVNNDELVKVVGGFAKSANQFVSNGVFGFNPLIQSNYSNEKKLKIVSEKSDLDGKTLKADFLIGLDALGESLKSQLDQIGVKLEVSYLEPEELLESLDKSAADIYFFAFKSDIGDSQGFFEDLVLENAEFNAGKYRNPELERLIGSAKTEMDVQKRLLLLQEAMEIAVDEDVFGVPLFEYETVFGFSPEFEYKPRIDGLIYFDDITRK